MRTEQPYEFFFYADSPTNAMALANELVHLDYEVSTEPSVARDGRILITGWTTPIPSESQAFEAWYAKMCEFAFTYGCEFDGYGTYVRDEDEVDYAI